MDFLSLSLYLLFYFSIFFFFFHVSRFALHKFAATAA